MTADLYNILGISPDADISEIRKAYRCLALRTHPDKGGSEQGFQLVALAFATLSCSASREAYDKTRVRRLSPNRLASQIQTEKRAPHGHRRSSEVQEERLARWEHRSCFSAVCPTGPSTGVANDESRTDKRMTIYRRRTQKALHHLRGVLQSLSPDQRQEKIRSMDSRLRMALVAFMEAHGQTNQRVVGLAAIGDKNSRFDCDQSRIDSCGIDMCNVNRKQKVINHSSNKVVVSRNVRAPTSGFVGVQKSGQMYRARTNIDSLELFTMFQPDIEVAIEHQIVLAHIRNSAKAMSEAMNLNMEDHGDAFFEVCRQCLAELGTSEENMQLRASVRMRVSYLSRSQRIASPKMSVCDATKIRCTLFRAKRCSWESLRSVWIAVMQHKNWKRKGKELSLTEAEFVADEAWKAGASQRFLQRRREETQRRKFERLRQRQQWQESRTLLQRRRRSAIAHALQLRKCARFSKAVSRAARALDSEERFNLQQERRKTVAEVGAARAYKKRVVEIQRRRQHELRQWQRRADLTMAEIMEGPPKHLRVG